MVLTRDSLRAGFLQDLVARGGDTIKILSEEELVKTRQLALQNHDPSKDLMLFAYGSLIWNPAFHFVDSQPARVIGLHRRFCLWTHLGRGSKDCPGLILGLDRGGSCQGLVFQIAASEIESELAIVWRREMVSAAYRPTWINVRLAQGIVPALTFVINRKHERYAGALDDVTIARSIASAQGPLGTCAEYLFNTHQHLAELGIPDPKLARLCERVSHEINRGNGSPSR